MQKIKIKEEITVDVIDELVDDNPIGNRETFNAGEILEIDVFDTQESAWGIQFGDGSVVYLPVNSFSIVID